MTSMCHITDMPQLQQTLVNKQESGKRKRPSPHLTEVEIAPSFRHICITVWWRLAVTPPAEVWSRTEHPIATTPSHGASTTTVSQSHLSAGASCTEDAA